MVHERQFIFMLKALELFRFWIHTVASPLPTLILIFLGFSYLIDKLKLE